MEEERVNNNTTLILGGARSGKSAYAEGLALTSKLDLIYIATAEALDDEMDIRIEHHKNQRTGDWKTIEEPIKIAEVILAESNLHNVILIDCLTLWLSNLLDKNLNVNDETEILVKAINQAKGHIIFVSNEVGQGIVPLNEVARHFRDDAGRLNQKIASHVANVYLIIAGLAMSLKENNKPITEKLN